MTQYVKLLENPGCKRTHAFLRRMNGWRGPIRPFGILDNALPDGEYPTRALCALRGKAFQIDLYYSAGITSLGCHEGFEKACP
jgi:hypothetical protein